MDARRKRKTVDLGIPSRWLNCPRKGSIIAEKFIPFKTTMSNSYDEQIPEANRFTPAMLLSSLNSYKVQLGMWIDLTNTNRFYDKKDVETRGITYVKLQCRGHGECPSVEQTKTFIQLSQKFISMYPMKVIGVHCTHGFNRTGFLIVAYLVESLSWSVEAAVDCFAKARPPGIYKADYLSELFSRYSDIADTPPAPPLPEWCNEPDDVDDNGMALVNGESASCEFQEVPRKRRKEFVKKNPTFMEGVPGVTSVTAQPKLSHVQRKCQMMCGWKSSGFPGSQPVSMDIENLKLLHSRPYKVSWKADGTRYMMLIDEKDKIFFVDRDNAVFQVSGLWFPRRKEPDKHICNTLLDGEMVIDKVNGDDVPRYLVYDIIKFEGVDVGKTDFERRLQCIQKEIVEPRIKAMTEGRLDRSKEPFGIRLKTFWDITAAKSLLGEKFRKDLSHEIDGLIFQPVPDPYVCGRCPEVLKWKPSSLNSVDFKLIIKQDHGEGLLPIKKGYLYVGGLDQPFAEIKLTKVMKLLDKKIIECKHEEGQWKFLRERTDKSFPNSYSTALGVCNSIRNPVTTEILLFEIDNHRWLPPAKRRDRPTVGQCYNQQEGECAMLNLSKTQNQ